MTACVALIDTVIYNYNALSLIPCRLVTDSDQDEDVDHKTLPGRA